MRRTRLVIVAIIFSTFAAILIIATGAKKQMDNHYFTGFDQKLEAAILADNGAVIDQALNQGANVNARGIHGITPLMLAVDQLKKKRLRSYLHAGPIRMIRPMMVIVL